VRQLVTFLLASLSRAFVWAPPSSAEPVQLRLSFQLPITGTLGVNLARFKEAVGRDTGNAVAIEIIRPRPGPPHGPERPARPSPA
jgi:hypothetical protein